MSWQLAVSGLQLTEDCQLKTANSQLMDEYNSGMDPEVKQLFRKILNSLSWGALWLLGIATMGIFFQLGFIAGGIHWYNILFYLILVASLLMLLRYYYKLWK